MSSLNLTPLTLAFSLAACTSEKGNTPGYYYDTGTNQNYVDNDGDGQTEAEGDCNDDDPTVFEGADELCDGVDNNCVDGEEDAADALTWYLDSDGDGYGDAGSKIESCTQPSGYADNTNDCNDSQPLAWLGNTEVCDGVDNDCDGDTDGTANDKITWYRDNDGDGYGIQYTTVEACFQPSGYTDNPDDCNDNEPLAWSGNTEVCDGVDNNCMTGESDAIDKSTWYTDGDGDGYGNPDNDIFACDPDLAPICFDVRLEDDFGDSWNGGALTIMVDGVMVDSGLPMNVAEGCVACDKQLAGTFYNSGISEEEYVNGAFCLSNGQTFEISYAADNYDDENTIEITSDRGVTLYFADIEESGDFTYNRIFNGLYTDNADDCNDLEALAWTGNTEVCDGVDNNCLDDENDAPDQLTWYADFDGDGYGDPNETHQSCLAPYDYVDNDNDCDDYEVYAWTGAPELCDGIDNNCVDGENDATDLGTWYMDADLDGYGDPGNSFLTCDPSFTETCFDVVLTDAYGDEWNGGALSIYVDGDLVDSGLSDGSPGFCDDCSLQTAGTFYNTGSAASETIADAFCLIQGQNLVLNYAADKYDDENDYQIISTDGLLLYAANGTDADFYSTTFNGFYSSNMDDCDDNEPLAWTGADELCDGVDNDCDGGVDIGALNTRVWYFDNDNDGYGVSSPTTNSCDEPVGYADNMDDCNDNDNAIGGSLIWYPDSDNDSYGSDVSSIESCYSQFGHVLNMDDCDDTDDTVGPSQFWYLDDDEDGYGDPSTGVDSCEQPSGYTDNMNDCDDNDDGVGNLIWYYDGDNDGYGDPGSSQNVCAQPGNHVDNMDDCDDTEDFTYPGAAYNESPSECLTDQDGDGYSPSPDICFTLDMMDIYGDGWNGGHLIVTADGTQVPSGQPSFNPPYGGNTIPADAFYEAGDGADGNLLNNTLTTVSFCVETDTNLVLTYYPGSYEDENVYVLSDIQENGIFNDGPTPSSGAVFSEYVTGGGDGLDCNDYDQNTTQCPN